MVDNARKIGAVFEETAQQGRGERRLFDVDLPLQGRELPVTVFSIGSGEQEITVLRGIGFIARTKGGIEDLARTMGPVPGARIRKAYRASLEESGQVGE